MNDLASRLARGDAEAYAQLYDACADRLFAYVAVRLGSPQDAADVLQETFLRLARHAGRFRWVSDPIAYTFIVARNETSRWLARERRKREQHKRLATSAAPADQAAACLPQETLEWVAVALSKLDAAQRDVVELKFFGGLTLAEIAAALGIPPGTAATRYRTALSRLRVCLARESL